MSEYTVSFKVEASDLFQLEAMLDDLFSSAVHGLTVTVTPTLHALHYEVKK